MKKVLVVIVLTAFASIAFGQLSMPKVEAPKVNAPKVEDPVYTAARTEFKKLVKDIPFDYKSSELKLNDPKYTVAGYSIDDFMKKVLIPALSKLVNVLPTDKKVVIDGHASARGSDDVNIPLSQARADAVLNYILANSQIAKAKLKTRANGSSKTLSGVDGSSDKNCRVSMDIE
jgi:outer membrane protein OmpA-like peptidoglycan-associated protein